MKFNIYLHSNRVFAEPQIYYAAVFVVHVNLYTSEAQDWKPKWQ